MTTEQQNLFQEWLKSRPEIIRKTAKQYPPGRYKIKDGAPYGISCPGTIVRIYSYTESGNVGVIVMASEKLEIALRHEELLATKFNTDPQHEKDILVQINPLWMEPYELL